MLEEQKQKLDTQMAGKKANFDAAVDLQKVEQGMANLARQVGARARGLATLARPEQGGRGRGRERGEEGRCEGAKELQK